MRGNRFIQNNISLIFILFMILYVIGLIVFMEPLSSPEYPYDVIGDHPDCKFSYTTSYYPFGLSINTIVDNNNDTFSPTYNRSIICHYPQKFIEDRHTYFPYNKIIEVKAFERKWFGDCVILTKDGDMWESINERTCLVLSEKGKINATFKMSRNDIVYIVGADGVIDEVLPK